MKVEEILLSKICNSPAEEIQGKCELSHKALEEYLKAIEKLSVLAQQGKLSFRCDDPHRKLPEHMIYVQWKADNGFIEADTREIIDFMKNLDVLLFLESNATKWQLSKVLYNCI